MGANGKRSKRRLVDKIRNNGDRSKLPDSDRSTLDPRYLLGHENHFDPNVHTPEELIEKGSLRGKLDAIKDT